MWDGFIGWIILLFNNFSLNGFSIYLDPCLNQISHRGLQNGDFSGRQLCAPLNDQCCTKWWFFWILLLLLLFSSILLEGRAPSSITFPFSCLIFVCTKYVCVITVYFDYIFLIMSLNSCFRLIRLLSFNAEIHHNFWWMMLTIWSLDLYLDRINRKEIR